MRQPRMEKGPVKQLRNVTRNSPLEVFGVVTELECRMDLLPIKNLNNVLRDGLHAPTSCRTLLENLRTVSPFTGVKLFDLPARSYHVCYDCRYL
jgi:hypothetical protein